MEPTAEWDRKQVVAFVLLELVVVAAIETIVLHLWKIDISVPFNYWGDTLWFVVPVKGITQNGWAYEIPQLSAPFSLSAIAFPSVTNLDWLWMKGISVVVSSAGAILNIFWLFSIVLTAWSATLALCLLRVNRWMAFGMGIVYAFLPFALLRNTAHINLVYYCVPLLSLLAIYFAQGCEHPRSLLVCTFGYGAALAQGFDYIYYSFFSVLLFAFAGCLGFWRIKSWKPIKGAAIACSTILLASLLNLTPSFLSWYKNGKPDVNYKSPEQAEIYGLKIRKMLAPHEANIAPLFRQWGQKDKSINFPNENENASARLGPMAAAGLLLLLMTSLGVGRTAEATYEWSAIRSAASLALFCLLFATVGGLGAIFNQIIPDFRGYNRFSVFIAFFALAGLGWWWQTRMQKVSPRARIVLTLGFVLLIVFSLYDQLLDARPLNSRRSMDELAAKHERDVIRQIEAKADDGALIFQLPLTGFPPDGGKERMLPYDHARPYLWSSKLHWSWPSFTEEHQFWVDRLDGFDNKELAEALVLSRFSLVWIDRFGYADNGDAAIMSLIAAGAKDYLPNRSSRYVVLDLSPVAERLHQEYSSEEIGYRQDALLNGPIFEWGSGFYSLEHSKEGRKFRWSQAVSTAVVRNPKRASRSVVLSFYVASGKRGEFTVSAGTKKLSVASSTDPTHVEVPLTLAPKSNVEVRFAGNMGKIDLPPGETRDLHFYLMDLHLGAVELGKNSDEK
jgi:phosphoglycerol transferase